METGTKILIGAVAGIAIGVGIYFATRTKTDDVAKKISDEDSEKIPLINEILSALAARTKFKDDASKKEMMKKEYDFLMTKTLKEVQEKLGRVKKAPNV